MLKHAEVEEKDSYIDLFCYDRNAVRLLNKIADG